MNTPAQSHTLPHSIEAEERLLTCCLIDGHDTIVRCLESKIEGAAFYSPANRLVYEKIQEIHQKNPPVDIEVLAEELKSSKQLETIGGYAYLAQITTRTPSTAHVQYYMDKVCELHRLREIIKTSTSTIEKCFKRVDDFGQLITVIERDFSGVLQAPGGRKATIWAEVESRRVKASKPPPEPSPRFYLADKLISTPGNLCNFIAKAKSGKTASIGSILASAVAVSLGKTNLDTLRFSANNPDGKALVVIDTEQSKRDAHRCLMRALDRAEESDEPSWLRVYGLVGYSADELCEALPVIMENTVKECGGIFAICLDGVADFVSDVNDLNQCSELVKRLLKLAGAHDCSILNVIHANEGKTAGNDGRGHLGKELMRKGESNLLLRKSGDVTTITSGYQRNAPISEQDGVAFKWSDEHHRHVSCACLAKAKDEAKRQELADLAEEVYNGAIHMRRSDLESGICKALDCTKGTGYNRVVKMIEFEVIKKAELGHYKRVT